MNLAQALEGRKYTIRDVKTHDRELDAFLFTLGCYRGEHITVILKQRSGCIVSIKDVRYHIDKQLAQAILV